MAEKLFHLFTATLAVFMLGVVLFNQHLSPAVILLVGGGLVALLAFSAGWLTVHIINQSEPVQRPSDPRG